MKAGAKPELSAAWWKKNKPKTLTKTGLHAALLEYERFAARDKGEEIPKQLKALDNVGKAVGVAQGKCNKSFHKETLAALTRYPKVIGERKRYLRDLEERLKAAAAPPKQKVGKPVVIWERDIAKQLGAWQKSNQGKFPDGVPNIKKGVVKLKLNDDILDVLEDNGDFVTPALMVEDAEGEWKKSEAVMQRAFLDWEKERVKPGASKKAFDKLDKALIQEMTDLKKRVEKVPETRFNKFVARQKQYKSYQIKTGVDAAWELASFGAGVALTVGSGGAGLALAIVGLVKSGSKLVGMLYDACIEAERVCKSLSKDLEDLQKSYLKGMGQAKKSLGAKEISKATVAGAFGELARPFLQTIPRCESNFTLWDNKVAGLEVKGRAASNAIVKAMDACDKCERELAKDKAKSRRIQKLLKDIQKLRANLDKALDKTHEIMARVRDAEKQAPEIKKSLKALKDAQSKPVAVISKIIPHLFDVGTGAAAGAVEIKAAKDTVDMIKACAGIVKDVADEAKGIVEDAKG